MEWSVDPDPNDTTITTDYAFILREHTGSATHVHGTHLTGLFPQATWLDVVASVGFRPKAVIDKQPRTEPHEPFLSVTVTTRAQRHEPRSLPRQTPPEFQPTPDTPTPAPAAPAQSSPAVILHLGPMDVDSGRAAVPADWLSIVTALNGVEHHL